MWTSCLTLTLTSCKLPMENRTFPPAQLSAEARQWLCDGLDEEINPIRSSRVKNALAQADIKAAMRQRGNRIEYDPHRRGDLFARLMTDQVLFDYRVITRTQADKDCDLTRRTSVHQIARDCLSLHGLSTQGTNAEVIERAFRMDNVTAFQRSYSTDAFPAILDSIGSKAMSLGYDNAPEVWPYIVRETTTKNFLEFTRVHRAGISNACQGGRRWVHLTANTRQ